MANEEDIINSLLANALSQQVSQVGVNNPWNIGSQIISQAPIVNKDMSTGARLGTTFGQALLGSLAGGIGQRQVQNQRNQLVNDIGQALASQNQAQAFRSNPQLSHLSGLAQASQQARDKALQESLLKTGTTEALKNRFQGRDFDIYGNFRGLNQGLESAKQGSAAAISAAQANARNKADISSAFEKASQSAQGSEFGRRKGMLDAYNTPVSREKGELPTTQEIFARIPSNQHNRAFEELSTIDKHQKAIELANKNFDSLRGIAYLKTYDPIGKDKAILESARSGLITTVMSNVERLSDEDRRELEGLIGKRFDTKEQIEIRRQEFIRFINKVKTPTPIIDNLVGRGGFGFQQKQSSPSAGIVKRLPKETPSEYLRRIGKQ